MALLKFLQGNSDVLQQMIATKGQFYFTPDDGKIYIDIENSTTPAVVGKKAEPGVQRICLNDFAEKDLLTIIDSGILNSELPAGTIIYDCDVPTDAQDILIFDCN